MSNPLASNRGRLVLLLLVATAAVTVLAISAASSSLSYYVTPEEFIEVLDAEGKQWRVGGRVVEGSIVEENGRPVRFEIEGEEGQRLTIAYDGIVPNLFGPRAFVVAAGVSEAPGTLRASEVVIKHENEFFSDDPPPGSPGAPPASGGGAQ